jgi:hypothetical protein
MNMGLFEARRMKHYRTPAIRVVLSTLLASTASGSITAGNGTWA